MVTVMLVEASTTCAEERIMDDRQFETQDKGFCLCLGFNMDKDNIFEDWCVYAFISEDYPT